LDDPVVELLELRSIQLRLPAGYLPISETFDPSLTVASHPVVARGTVESESTDDILWVFAGFHTPNRSDTNLFTRLM